MKTPKSVRAIAEQPMAANDITIGLGSVTDGLMKSLEICFPVCVYSYDRRSHKVKVLPLVKQAYYQGKWRFIRRMPFEVTIRSIQCGGFCIDYPVYVGDTGWVFSSDRDTAFLKEDEAPTALVLGKDREAGIVEDKLPQVPRQPRLHALMDGFFLPDNWGKWEFSRFKDANGVRLSDSLYIGTSFYDSDEEDADGSTGESSDLYESDSESESEGESSDSSDASDSSDTDDGTYEGNPSASIVMTRNGIIHLMASSKEKAKRHAHFKIKKDGIKVTLADDNEKKEKIWKKAVLSLNLDNGIEIDCKGEHQSNSFTLDDNGLEMKFKSDKAKDGKDVVITMSPKLDVNITTPGEVKVSADSVTTECKKITTIGEETSFNITSLTGTASKVVINASEEVAVRALGDVSLASSKKVFIGAAGEVAIGCVGQGGRVSVESHGGDIILDAGNGKFDIKGGGCSIQMHNGTLSLSGDTVSLVGDTLDLTTSIGILNDTQFINGNWLIIS